jgi:hypothetical protein
MAKNGFKLIDAEMHVMEPVDLWQRYIDPEFRDRAPRRLDERRWDTPSPGPRWTRRSSAAGPSATRRVSS